MAPQGLPPSPFTDLAATAVQMHELFTAWVNAGFTEEQAMQMMCTILAGATRRGES